MMQFIRNGALIALIFLMSGMLSCAPKKETPSQHNLLNSTLWMQQAAEHKALCLQAYNTAERMLNRALQDKNWTAATEQSGAYQQLPPAVILDVDETVLDNSPYEAHLIKSGQSYSRDSWKAWCNEAKARAIPGAVDFCNAAHAKGVTVFYVTNRRKELKEATRNNLTQAGFPLETNVETIIPRGESSDKGPRRAAIAKNYRILLLIGDNAGDFYSGFTHGAQAKRDSLAEACSANWGTKWIVLPNPMYGDWEGAIYNYQYRLPSEEKNKIKFQALE